MTEIRVSDWPEEMTTKTLAKYLDEPSPATLNRKIKKWPDFPKPSPITKRWWRREVDEFIAEAHGYERSVSAERHRLGLEDRFKLEAPWHDVVTRTVHAGSWAGKTVGRRWLV